MFSMTGAGWWAGHHHRGGAAEAGAGANHFHCRQRIPTTSHEHEAATADKERGQGIKEIASTSSRKWLTIWTLKSPNFWILEVPRWTLIILNLISTKILDCFNQLTKMIDNLNSEVTHQISGSSSVDIKNSTSFPHAHGRSSASVLSSHYFSITESGPDAEEFGPKTVETRRLRRRLVWLIESTIKNFIQ